MKSKSSSNNIAATTSSATSSSRFQPPTSRAITHKYSNYVKTISSGPFSPAAQRIRTLANTAKNKICLPSDAVKQDHFS